MRMAKRGQSLPLNTIIIAIIVVVVLIAIITFFLSGTSGLTRTIRSVFYGTTAGTDKVLAVQTCEQRCEQAKSMPENLRRTSAYCASSFNIDENNDGEADYATPGDKNSGYAKFFCYRSPPGTGEQSLNVPCIASAGELTQQIQCQ